MTVEEVITQHSKSEGLARSVAALRVLRGLTQAQLAEATRLDNKTISFIETGRVEPYNSTVEKLARALEVPVETLRG